MDDLRFHDPNPALRLLAFGMGNGQTRMLTLRYFRLHAAARAEVKQRTRPVG
jgi:hypothetical protein